MLQQHLAIGPALALLAYQVPDWDTDVLEMDLVHFVSTLYRDDRTNRDPFGLHVDEQKTDAFLAACNIGARTDETKNPVSVLAERRPGLRAVDDVVIIIPDGTGPQ